MIAAFAAEYGAELTAPFRPRCEATLMMQPRPRATIAGYTACAMKNMPFRCTSDDAVEVRLGVVLELLADVHAGVVEQDVDRPECARRLPAANARRGSDVRDVDRAVHRAASQRADFAGGLIRLCAVIEMAERDIRALGRERSAVARPMPRDPPVISAIWPCSFIAIPSCVVCADVAPTPRSGPRCRPC